VPLWARSASRRITTRRIALTSNYSSAEAAKRSDLIYFGIKTRCLPVSHLRAKIKSKNYCLVMPSGESNLGDNPRLPLFRLFPHPLLSAFTLYNCIMLAATYAKKFALALDKLHQLEKFTTVITNIVLSFSLVVLFTLRSSTEKCQK